jgi:hypothetical protein
MNDSTTPLKAGTSETPANYLYISGQALAEIQSVGLGGLLNSD